MRWTQWKLGCSGQEVIDTWVGKFTDHYYHVPLPAILTSIALLNEAVGLLTSGEFFVPQSLFIQFYCVNTTLYRSGDLILWCLSASWAWYGCYAHCSIVHFSPQHESKTVTYVKKKVIFFFHVWCTWWDKKLQWSIITTYAHVGLQTPRVCLNRARSFRKFKTRIPIPDSL